MDLALDGNAALCTAASSGLGLASATALAREGADVAVCGRTVIGLVKTVAREFAPAVWANAVLPGAHETGRIEDLIEESVDRDEYPDYEAGYEDWASDGPLDRIGDPSELGDVVAFLASPRASYRSRLASTWSTSSCGGSVHSSPRSCGS